MTKDGETTPFWRRKRLDQMTPTEWESLCDGCGKCCLNKLEDAETGVIAYTDVACRLLDLKTCRCGNYAKRKSIVPDCEVLTPEAVARFKWLPSTCAYRLLWEGKDLPGWHPLVSGSPESVHQAGISVRGRAISEDPVLDVESRIVDWPK
ncbi:MAG: YcgN family cysteine cluster protein [Rhodospirillales bacterium]|nr:YcgN family cysteine cluster protein [Rhodospirillales bacterium]